jgi:hypothetical protein
MMDDTATPKANASPEVIGQVKAALSELDREFVEINGSMLKPSQCYRLGLNPPYILYNANCPDDLKERIQTILSNFIKARDETGASK